MYYDTLYRTNAVVKNEHFSEEARAFPLDGFLQV
jgi:hypothetical protein